MYRSCILYFYISKENHVLKTHYLFRYSVIPKTWNVLLISVKQTSFIVEISSILLPAAFYCTKLSEHARKCADEVRMQKPVAVKIDLGKYSVRSSGWGDDRASGKCREGSGQIASKWLSRKIIEGLVTVDSKIYGHVTLKWKCMQGLGARGSRCVLDNIWPSTIALQPLEINHNCKHVKTMCSVHSSFSRKTCYNRGAVAFNDFRRAFHVWIGYHFVNRGN